MFDGNRKTLEAKLAAAEAHGEAAKSIIDDKNEQIARLQAQVDRLQDALVARTSPQAYEDRKLDQQDAAYVPSEDTKNQAARARINGELLWHMEQPAFSSADDMISALTGATDVDVLFNRPLSESNHGES